MRWLELLVAGIFTYEVTQSTVLVALLTVARSLPMLFIGTIAGVVGEALNRKRLLVAQLFVMAVSSAVLCALACGSRRRIRLANGWPNFRAHYRTVSWLTMMPRAASNSSTIRSPSGNRKYSQTAWLMISQGNR
jgi:MFS family permease